MHPNQSITVSHSRSLVRAQHIYIHETCNKHASLTMFPLSCVRVTSAHKKPGAHTNVSSKNVFARTGKLFHTRHSKYSVVKCCAKKITCAHRLKKLEGTLLINIQVLCTYKSYAHTSLMHIQVLHTYKKVSLVAKISKSLY